MVLYMSKKKVPITMNIGVRLDSPVVTFEGIYWRIPKGWTIERYIQYGMTYGADGHRGSYRMREMVKGDRRRIYMQRIIQERN